MTDQLVALVRQLTISQRIGIAFGAVFSVLLLVGLVMWAGQPQLTPAFTKLSTADAGVVTDALDGAGIPYELADGGRTVRVPSAQVADARVAAGTAGYTNGDTPGFELFDQQNFGTSEFDQQVTYQRAIEGKLTRTIEAMEGVASATVNVVAAQTGVLSATDAPASASVVLRMAGGGHPGDALVQGVVTTVSGAVSGLAATNVSVVDADGTVLAGPNGTAGNALAMQGSVERMLASKVQVLIDAALGPGHASVAVSADLDLDKVEKQITTYKPIDSGNWTPTSVQITEERYGQGGAAGPGGIPGTTSNVPGLPVYQTIPAASASPGASPSGSPGASPSGSPGASPSASAPAGYEKVQQTTNYATTAEVSHVIAAPGSIKRLSVAVLLDETAMGSVAKETLDGLIRGAVGFDEARGDSVSVAQVAFAAPVAGALATGGDDLMGMVGGIVPQVAGGLLAFVLLVLVWRNMRALRGRAEDMALATARTRTAQLGSGGDLLAGSLRELAPGQEDLLPASPQAKIQERIRLMAEDKPDELAGLVNTWLREDERAERRR